MTPVSETDGTYEVNSVPSKQGRRNLDDLYTSYEKTLHIVENDNEFSSLPHFNGNKTKPLHRWFTYKEGFSAKLLKWVCKTTKTDLDSIESLLDPFVGVGTSLLTAQLEYRGKNNLNLIGIERNPFTAFVARTKLNWFSFDEKIISDLIPDLVSRVSNRNGEEFDIADLSTLKNEKVFDRNQLQDLLFARKLITSDLVGKNESDFFKLGWASIIETVSNVRKDGRALRIVDKDARPPVYKLLEAKWQEMLKDIKDSSKELSLIERGEIKTNIFDGDGRTLETLPENTGKFDLILYSPPYLNNLDYSEVYKMELWLTEAIKSQDEFRNLRLSTMRSHPSITFPETDLVDNLPSTEWSKILRDSLIDLIPQGTHQKARVRIIRAYMDDMLLTLQKQFIYSKSGSYVICVVGNSVHGNKEHSIPIATDLLISSLAQFVGFEVERLQITRYTKRRDYIDVNQSIKKAQRETIIVLRHP